MRAEHRYGKTIDDADCRQIANLIRSGALTQLESLRLSLNQISDEGTEELASAFGSRLLPNLSRLWLSNNKARSCEGFKTRAADLNRCCPTARGADRRRRDG